MSICKVFKSEKHDQAQAFEKAAEWINARENEGAKLVQMLLLNYGAVDVVMEKVS